jgi:hypothetical protein
MSARLVIVLAAIAGCTWGTPAGPAVARVAPASVEAGATAVLAVTASELDPLAVVDFDDPTGAPVCDWFRVELRSASSGTVPLEDVVRVGATALRGRLPNSAKSGVYDVVLIDSSGREGTLAGAFEVLKCLPPNGECHDGNTCTQDDACTGAARCAPGTSAPDGTACTFRCTWGDVAGSCAAGVCVPPGGACPPAPTACTDG